MNCTIYGINTRKNACSFWAPKLGNFKISAIKIETYSKT
jgi:hypothetical protein